MYHVLAGSYKQKQLSTQQAISVTMILVVCKASHAEKSIHYQYRSISRSSWESLPRNKVPSNSFIQCEFNVCFSQLPGHISMEFLVTVPLRPETNMRWTLLHWAGWSRWNCLNLWPRWSPEKKMPLKIQWSSTNIIGDLSSSLLNR